MDTFREVRQQVTRLLAKQYIAGLRTHDLYADHLLGKGVLRKTKKGFHPGPAWSGK